MDCTHHHLIRSCTINIYSTVHRLMYTRCCVEQVYTYISTTHPLHPRVLTFVHASTDTLAAPVCYALLDSRCSAVNRRHASTTHQQYLRCELYTGITVLVQPIQLSNTRIKYTCCSTGTRVFVRRARTPLAGTWLYLARLAMLTYTTALYITN